MIDYRTAGASQIGEVKKIYRAHGWSSYLGDDGKLSRALENSLYILGAFDSNKLVGFIRCVGDGEHIVYVQDIIVLPEYQRRGIGRELMKRVSEHFRDVRQFVLITDAEDPVSNAFYNAIGMVKTCRGFGVEHYFREGKIV